ncbi:ribonuclease H-like domain-containing protein [Tanacetum coccineum]
MSTRSTSSNLFSPLRDPESLIRRRNLGEPSSLFDFEEVISIPHNNQGPPPAGPPPPNNNGPPPVATDFGLRHHMIQQVQNTFQFHGLPGDDANRHIDKFLEVTQHMKQNGVFDDALHTIQSTRREELYATDTEESYDRSRTYRSHNHWDTSATRDETSRTISSTTTTESPEVVRQLELMNKNFLDMMRQIQSVKSVSPKYETCGGPHSFTECLAIDGYTQEAAYATTAPNNLIQVGPSNELTNYMKSNESTLRAMQTQMTNMKTELRNEFKSSLDARTNKIENQNNQMMNIGVAYDGPTIPPTPSPLPKEERETEATKDKVQTTSSESTAHVQPLVVQVSILEPEVTPKPNPKPSIPYPSRLNVGNKSSYSNTTAKLPILKLGEYEIWVIRIKQYFQVQDYALWEVIENESLDSIFNRLQKIVSGLAILGVVIAQEDLNSKILNSLPPEWNTHVVVWMNKAEIKTMSIDDLYNNFKIVEQSVNKSIFTSSGAQNLAFMTAPSTSSTNDVNTAKPAYEVSTASPQVSTASFSDNDVYAFMVDNPNGSNLLQTGNKIFINANDTAGYDKSKVECFNCHKMGHFNRKCRAPRNKEGQFKNQDNTRKHGNNEDTSSKVMLAIDGVGFDWSDMAEEQVQTNMALMAFSDSEVYNDKTCSKTCLKNYETLKKQCDDLIVKLNQTEFTVATYKRGLATVEEQLITYRKNEVLFSEEVAVLKREVACKDYKINVLKSEFEKVKQEKEGIEYKIKKFNKVSKDLNQLLKSQITNKSKKSLGYNAFPPPHPLIDNRPKKLDLSYSGLDEFKEPEFKAYGYEVSKQESNIVCDKKIR